MSHKTEVQRGIRCYTTTRKTVNASSSPDFSQFTRRLGSVNASPGPVEFLVVGSD